MMAAEAEAKRERVSGALVASVLISRIEPALGCFDIYRRRHEFLEGADKGKAVLHLRGTMHVVDPVLEQINLARAKQALRFSLSGNESRSDAAGRICEGLALLAFLQVAGSVDVVIKLFQLDKLVS